MGLVEQDESGGRKITKEGQRELDTVAVQAATEEEEASLWPLPLAPSPSLSLSLSMPHFLTLLSPLAWHTFTDLSAAHAMLGTIVLKTGAIPAQAATAWTVIDGGETAFRILIGYR